jgi:NAD+ kinase
MEREIKKVLIVVNLKKRDAEKIAEDISEYLRNRQIEVDVLRSSGSSIELEQVDYDLAFSLGGDGTVLFSARLLAIYKIPIMAVNIGDFGFITEVSKDEWQSAFESYQKGGLGLSERVMLSTSVRRNDTDEAEFIALNDSVISAAGISKVVRLKVTLADTYLGRYRADGVIVSTPTGSTAYSAAAGGPILDPEMDALILNPICPFTLSNRPIVLRGNSPVYIEIEHPQRTGVILTIDGQNVFQLQEGDVLRFETASPKALIIRSDKRNFFEVLRSKLNWSGGPDA